MWFGKKNHDKSNLVQVICLIGLVLFSVACSKGNNGSRGTAGCDGSCADKSSFLTTEEVGTILSQAVLEAQALGVKATIAVVDRVGNVLAVFRMTDAATTITITSTDGEPTKIIGGLENITIIPDTLVAIAKAITGAFLSTEGNAFTTRTASQIVQEHFNPGETDQPGGPLFGVQFSQLPCSDLTNRFVEDTPTSRPGPKRSPLGLSADPGGLPIYKDGTPVGAIGVIADGIYGLDKEIAGSLDRSIDELIALAGTVGFVAPEKRRADQITIDGKTARFSDVAPSNLLTNAADAPDFSAINGIDGMLVPVTGYFSGTSIIPGKAFGSSDSGIRADDGLYDSSLDAFVLVDTGNDNRFPPIAGMDAPDGSVLNALTTTEVTTLLESALAVANQTRAQIRRPLGTPARVTISIVDTDGNILGIIRGRDAPIFGIDVSLQKARTAAFFSGTGATESPADVIRDLPNPVYLDGELTPLALSIDLDDYVSELQSFIGIPDALETSGPAAAFADRSGGNLSRPFYPDGIEGTENGPLSKPAGEWSVFSSGLQLDIIYNAIIHHIGFVVGILPSDIAKNCTGNQGLVPAPFTFGTFNPTPKLRNGLQIFPGSVPIYRDGVLVGGIGVSGDGVDQDDLIAFLGLDRAGETLGTINNAPTSIRADKINIPNNTDLRFVNCPQAPFIDSEEFEVCDGK